MGKEAAIKPSAIITSDWHIRDDQPICRLDDYFKALEKKMQWLTKLQKDMNIPILFGGDLFHHWKPSPYLLQWSLQHLPDGIVAVCGNHDLPAHSLENYDKCGLAVLQQAGKIKVPKSTTRVTNEFEVSFFPWGVEVQGAEHTDVEFKQVALIHLLTYQGRLPFPGCISPSGRAVIRSMPNFDLIIAGDNHKHFIVEMNGRKLISPGSLTRTTADQADYKPHVFLWYAETNEIVPVAVPIEEGVISREHIDAVERKDERIDAFVSKLSGELEIGLSFEQNLESFFSTNRTRKPVESIVWDSVKGGV